MQHKKEVDHLWLVAIYLNARIVLYYKTEEVLYTTAKCKRCQLQDQSIVDYSFLDAALATSDLSTCRRSRCSSIITAGAPATEEDAATVRAAGAPVPCLELGLKICDELEEADLAWR